MTDTDNKLTARQVEDYLQEHPDFFHDHVNLLEHLSIPHPSGEAVSLISKQLEIFRNKHHELETQLNTLIDIARENDTALNRMHELTLAMLEAKSLDEITANLEQVLSECFLTDFVSVKVIVNEAPPENKAIFVQNDQPELNLFQTILSSNEPQCGRLTLAQARFLFSEQATEVKSCAIIPMAFTELEGILAIGSRDENRFHRSMGHLFLTQMSEIVGTRLISLLK